MKRWTAWISLLLAVALLGGCANADSYVKDHYLLVNVQGAGNSVSKVYAAQGKSVPAVAAELAAEEKPREKSQESPDQMFLVYDNKIVNIQKDPKNADNSLVEINTIEYARDHYDSSFLQGYLTATVLQSLFGSGWLGSSHGGYRGYSTAPYSPAPAGGSGSAGPGSSASQPSTSKGSGSFTSGNSSPSASGSVRKNDGSVPKVSNGAGSSGRSYSTPRTSSRSGSFKRR